MGPAGAFVPYEVIVPPGSILATPPESGDKINFIQFRSGTKSQPIPQTADRHFQIVLDYQREGCPMGVESTQSLSQAPRPLYSLPPTPKLYFAPKPHTLIGFNLLF